MKCVVFLGCLLLSLYSTNLAAQVYTPVDNSSSVKFTIKNFGFNVEGSFKHLQGSIRFDPQNLSSSVFTVSVDAATVNTNNNSRDNHLKKEEYFNATKFQVILFTSDKIEKAATGNGYTATGKFTIKGIAKTAFIPFTAIPRNNGWLFTGKVELNRRDFGVGGNSFVLSDNLILQITVSAMAH